MATGGMQMKSKICFPSLENTIYESRQKEELWENYIAILRSDYRNLIFEMYANKLEEISVMSDPKKLSQIKEEVNEFKVKINPWVSQEGISYELKFRQKDFVGLNQKIRLYSNQGKLISKVNDFLGFRIIINSFKSEIENIGYCYKFLEMIIEFLVIEGHCIILEAEPTIETGFQKDKYPNIIIPSQPMLNPYLKGFVKDYICHPKKNGYQSLHIIFKKTDGLIFEVQIRTQKMDFQAENGDAEHNGYKKDRYLGEEIIIDPYKVNIEGFHVDENGEIHDSIGLIKSIDPFATK